jgi:hypothetical protein
VKKELNTSLLTYEVQEFREMVAVDRIQTTYEWVVVSFSFTGVKACVE